MRASVLVGLLLFAPLALAQEHGHENENGASMVLFDGPPDGRALVGAYTHFGFALLKEGAPVVHQNAEFNVVQNGEILFSTTDTHEYDGLFSFDVRFPRAGPYQVTATSGEMTLGVFEGVAHEPSAPVAATIVFEAAPQGPASRVLDVTVSIVDEAGALIPHSDAIVEFRDARDGSFHSRSHLHIHDAPITFSQGFGAAPDYVATVIGYVAFAEEGDPEVPAVVAEFPVNVGPLSVPTLPMPDPAPPAPLEQTGAVASGGGVTLRAMYDPNNQVGVGQTARLAAVIVDDATHAPLAHVDVAFTLTGPRGLVFSSGSLHEYDGVFEHVFVPGVPGLYEGTLTARDLSVPFELLVLPPAVPLVGGTGPVMLAVEGADDVVARVPVNLTFRAAGPAGPAKHSEVDVTIDREGEAPIYQFKLHTHGSGLTNAVVAFPEEGEWRVRIDGLPTVPEPSVYLPSVLTISVAPGAPGGEVPAGVAAPEGRAAVPSAALVFVVGALGAAALTRSRRPPS